MKGFLYLALAVVAVIGGGIGLEAGLPRPVAPVTVVGTYMAAGGPAAAESEEGEPPFTIQLLPDWSSYTGPPVVAHGRADHWSIRVLPGKYVVSGPFCGSRVVLIAPPGPVRVNIGCQMR